MGKLLLFHVDVTMVFLDITLQYLHFGEPHAVEWCLRLGVVGIEHLHWSHDIYICMAKTAGKTIWLAHAEPPSALIKLLRLLRRKG